MELFMVLHRDRDAYDGSLPPEDPNRCIVIPEGCHKVERIRNPLGCEDDWIVLHGTKRGASMEFWLENMRPENPHDPKIPEDMVVEFLQLEMEENLMENV